MSVVLGFAPLIMFLALVFLFKCYMTEKRKFTYKDKLILTIGGFILLMVFGGLTRDIYFVFIAFPFLFHAIILVLPVYIHLWKDFFHILRR